MKKSRKKITNSCKVKCGALNEIEVSYFSINEIDLIPSDKKGWYCWFYVPESPDTLNIDFIKYYKPRATIEGIFGIRYHGALKDDAKKLDIKDVGQCFDDLQHTILAFSSPLYIGISKSLTIRLKRHKSQLEARLNTDSLIESEDINDIKNDSDEESSFFGQRIASQMNLYNIKYSELYVKCVYSSSIDNLERVETVLNRMFLPPYGRR